MNKFTVIARLDIQSFEGGSNATLADIESYLTDMLEVPQDPETEPGEPFYVTDLTVHPPRPAPNEPLDDTVRRVYELGEGTVLEVKLTHEGVIVDAFGGNEHLGTHGMTAHEWYDQLAGEER